MGKDSDGFEDSDDDQDDDSRGVSEAADTPVQSTPVQSTPDLSASSEAQDSKESAPSASPQEESPLEQLKILEKTVRMDRKRLSEHEVRAHVRKMIGIAKTNKLVETGKLQEYEAKAATCERRQCSKIASGILKAAEKKPVLANDVVEHSLTEGVKRAVGETLRNLERPEGSILMVAEWCEAEVLETQPIVKTCFSKALNPQEKKKDIVWYGTITDTITSSDPSQEAATVRNDSRYLYWSKFGMAMLNGRLMFTPRVFGDRALKLEWKSKLFASGHAGPWTVTNFHKQANGVKTDELTSGRVLKRFTGGGNLFLVRPDPAKDAVYQSVVLLLPDSFRVVATYQECEPVEVDTAPLSTQLSSLHIPPNNKPSWRSTRHSLR